MTVEGVQTPAGPGFAFVEPSRQGATPKLSTTVSRGQAFGMDYDFLSPRAARGKRTNDFVSGAIDMLVAAVTLLVNALMLAIALYSVISAGPLAVVAGFRNIRGAVRGRGTVRLQFCCRLPGQSAPALRAVERGRTYFSPS